VRNPVESRPHAHTATRARQTAYHGVHAGHGGDIPAAYVAVEARGGGELRTIREQPGTGFGPAADSARQESGERPRRRAESVLHAHTTAQQGKRHTMELMVVTEAISQPLMFPLKLEA
jgi:hypothetical protein